MIGVRHRESISFLGVGATAAAVHFTTVWILVQTEFANPAWANVLAFWGAFAVSYFGHAAFTFAGNGGPGRRSMLRWLTVSLSGFILNQSLYVAALRWLSGIHYLILLFMVTCAVTVLTYLLGKYWAFHLDKPA